MAPRRKRCAWCGEEFTVEGRRTKFCSQTCMGAHSRRRVELTCSTCGATFERPAAWVKKAAKRRYCSKVCADAGRVRSGSTPRRGRGWSKAAEAVRERDGHKCVRCGGADEGRKLAVDHVFPWRWLKHAEAIANDERNLASLCLACHGLKTTLIEPRLDRGDFLALDEFYGRERSHTVQAFLAESKVEARP